MEKDKIKISLVALGCSKNLVDAENMVTILKNDGFIMVDDPASSDVCVINTCGFIESAKREAIDTILDVADLKSDPELPLKYIVVSGCLPQRYSKDILTDLPEVDAVLGTSNYGDIARVVSSLFEGQKERETVGAPGGFSHLLKDHDISTTGFAWLKIGEGCRHRCAFCAIPLIRGNFVSRPMEDILEEARITASKGYREIVLAAQDTTNYGIDLYGKRTLAKLLSELSKIDGIDIIRVMYGYMDGIDDELINEIKTNPKVAHYLDIPIQHGDNEVLRRMFRKDTEELISERLEKIRREIPDVVIRTTVMVGFPGETEEQFTNLKNNLLKWRFDRLGCFMFSPEEGTKAYDMDDQIEESVKQRRYEEIYELQRDISREKNEKRLGTEVEVTIDSIAEDGIFYQGRSYGEAPDVDPLINVAASDGELVVGQRYKVKIVDCSDYELTGVTINESSQ